MKKKQKWVLFMKHRVYDTCGYVVNFLILTTKL